METTMIMLGDLTVGTIKAQLQFAANVCSQEAARSLDEAARCAWLDKYHGICDSMLAIESAKTKAD